MPLLTGEHREHHGLAVREAAMLADAGLLTPRLDPRTFHLETLEEAYETVEDRTSTGKVVVTVASGHG